VSKSVKTLGIAAGGIVGLLAVALLVANLYLQSEGVQARIRQAAQEALGAPIKLGGTYFTPWGGFVIRAISVPNPENPETSLLDADSLRINFSLLSLLRGRMVVNRITLNNPTLTARQTPERKWVLLVPPPPKREIPVTVPPSADAPKPPGPRTVKVEVQNIRIRGAEANFLDAKGRTVLHLERGSLDARLEGGRASGGSFEIGRIEASQVLRPKNIKGTFLWDGQRLIIPDTLTGTLAGGTLRGTYELEAGRRFQLELALDGANLKKLTQDAGGDARRARGKVNARLSLGGEPGNKESIEGTATVDMIAARFVPVDFLVQLGELLGVAELQVLDLQEATSRFTIAGGAVLVDDIRLKSENLMLTGSGTAEFDGDLALDGKLLVNKKLQKQLRALMGKNFVASDDPEYKMLEFKVTNTLSNPKTDLLDKLIGIRVGDDMGGLIRNLFKAPSPPKEKKSKD
jgi:hypothetical protein